MSAVSNVVESELNVQKMCFDKTLIYDVHLLSGETGTLMLSPCTFDHYQSFTTFCFLVKSAGETPRSIHSLCLH